MKYIVVQVEQDYDYVQGIEILGSFLSEERATQYILDKEAESRESFKAYEDYLNKFLDSLNIQEKFESYEEYEKYLEQFKEIWGKTYHNYIIGRAYNHMRESIKQYIKSGYGANFKGFNPPKLIYYSNLFVGELP